MHLAINSIVRIVSEEVSGLYRVIAMPTSQSVAFLYRVKVAHEENKTGSCGKANTVHGHARRQSKLIAFQVDELTSLENEGRLVPITLEPEPRLLASREALSEKERELYDRRVMLAGPLMDHHRVADALLSPRGIGKLIAEVRLEHKVSRAQMYRLWDLLCEHGFDTRSLNPRLDRCGAPGEIRPCGEPKKKVGCLEKSDALPADNLRKKTGRKTNKERLNIVDPAPQLGTTREMRTKVLAAYNVFKNDPTLTGRTRYIKIINNAFIQGYRNTPAGLEPIPPAQGTFPNTRAVRRIVASELNKLERKLIQTTQRHFDSNYRGLTGKAWEGAAGPGHIYAIDSTVGDIYLRSSVNRAWSVGRPIVYIVVDVWSTAVVGFYVCLTGPSWATAKVALFSVFFNPIALADIWGYQAMPCLFPFPTAPHAFLCDRGEYLSAGALATGKELGINMLFNPTYRPDLKGLVEVLHRIAKDQQFQFIPGAIDARRKELELRANPRDSLFTLQEYVIYLIGVFTQYNLFSDRSYRLTSEMIAVGVDPCPAGLWRFGHDVGVGYRKVHTDAQLITSLLPAREASIRRDGVYFGGMQYEAPIAKEMSWTGIARNFGAMYEKMHYFPGRNSYIWWLEAQKRGLQKFTLSSTSLAAPGISLDEWLDARAYSKLSANDREYKRLVGALMHLKQTEALIENAREKTEMAEVGYQGPQIGTRDARSLENYRPDTSAEAPAPANPSDAVQKRNPSDEIYESMMDELFAARSGETENR